MIPVLLRTLRGLILAALLLVPGPTLAQAGAPWPQQASDLAADPDVVFGVLPNGMRYSLQKNSTPPGQVSVRFIILAGSMHEAPGQEGLAHFLEHMAFHGSRRMQDGQLMFDLQRLGVRLGADANAFTTQGATIYTFDLARNDDASLDTVLLFSREVASELSLDPVAFDAERNVIRAEATARAGADSDATMAMLAAHLGNHPYARIPIGRPEVIATAPVSRLRAFYDAYYRPERAVLVIAGDIDPARVEARIRSRFADWSGRGPAGAEPAPIVAPPAGPTVSARAIPGASASSLLLSWFRPYASPDYGRAEALDDVVEIVGDYVLRTRLRADLERSGKPAFDINPSGLAIPGVARGTVLEARVVSDLDASIAVLVRGHRQLMQFGYSQAEVDEAVTALRAQLQREAAVAATRQTPAIANVTANAVMARELLLSAQQKLDLFDAATTGLSAERVTRLARARFPGEPRLLYFGGADRIDTARLQAAYDKARGAAVTAYAAAAAKPWTHTNFGPAGKVVSRREEAALGVTLVRFANNVRLTVKPAVWSKGEVQVMVRFGHGQLDLPRDRIAASDWATILLMTGGLKDFTAQELARTLAGKNVYAFIQEADDAFELSNTSQGRSITRPEQLDLQLQLMTAYVTLPGWRPDEWANLETTMVQAAQADEASPPSYYRRESRRLLHAGDIRWVVSEPEMRVGWKPEQAVAHLKPILDTSPLEVIIVGDVTVDAAVAAVGKTLGALPRRPDRPEPKGLRDVRLPGPTAMPIVLKHKGPKSQAISGIHWPATDAFANPRETQAARLLSDLLGARAFEELRVKRGKTYAPDSAANLSTVLPGYGEIGVTVITPPEDVPLVYETLDRIAADLAAREITPDEFSRLIGPRIEQVRREQRTNAYWMENLKDAQTDPRLMRLAENTIRDMQSLTPADLRAAAQKWLVKSKSWRLSIVPE